MLPKNNLTFEETLGSPLLSATRVTTLQINLGLVCNLACRHCHVESSPKRTSTSENMSQETAKRVLDWLCEAKGIDTVDLTGGSPEMNPHFRLIVKGAREMRKRVIDRCNPTILVHQDAQGNRYDWVPSFLAEHQVQVVASLPCYLEENVRKQRGVHAYPDSIEGIRLLNQVGYGKQTELPLTLVYNPGGPHLPPSQESLEQDYRRELRERWKLEFTNLITITNMPIKRWRADLERQNKLADYLQLLSDSYNPKTVDGLMCRHQIHMDSQGLLHDCDFNYALDLPAISPQGTYLWDIKPEDLIQRPIATGEHCFGCTAGSGSSCGGSLT